MGREIFIAWCLCAIVGAYYGTKNGMGISGFFLGLLGGPWGVEFVLKTGKLDNNGKLIATVVGLNLLTIAMIVTVVVLAKKYLS